ncbi:hypothetical protein SAMN02910384_01234 [Pseudobutyrivibrio sp. ACV-2]|uniref:hypothetical protein n=1 Tax=Pseudobutyrivibrio sp. ACV-2 TaxID=1520801 RepID=UPI00089D2484|nr:hypothetical protein [Pseudobutyrivibrio sp. ACV-2]SEA29767.1 hypothetical protein SAMN02910384_01234 [Pseudobutyrivibrio sp. ACV-2]
MKEKKIIEYEKIYKAVPKLGDLSARPGEHRVFSNREDEVIYNTGNYVLVPVLNSFVLHVLEEAMNKGIKTLFFLARDAYFYYRIAEKYVKEFDLNINCKYLYVSRLSLRVPLYHLDVDQALSYITLSGVDVTPTTVLNRSGLSEGDKTQFIQKIADFLGIGVDEQIPRHRLKEVKAILKNDIDFLGLLIENSKKEFLSASKYLEEAGFGNKEKIAIVDSGWVGSIQQSLNKFHIAMGGQEPIEGYYYGLYEIPPKAEEKYYHSFLFGPRSRLKEKVAFNNCLFECVFSAPHGMTLRYKYNPKGTVPVLSDITVKQIAFLNQIDGIIDDYQENLLREYDNFQDICTLFNNPISKKTIEKALFNFMSKPSLEEAKVFGQLHFSDDVIDYDNAVLATRLTEKDLHDNHFLKRVYLELREMIFGKRYVVNISGWYEASVMLYAKPATVRYHLTAYNHYKYYMQYSKRKRWIRERERYETT